MINILNFFGLYTRKQLREVGDAHIELCAIECDMLSELYNAKVGFDVGYKMGTQRCAKALRLMKSENLGTRK